ncbi:MAG: RsiV family protein [Oscillospiraceae bacterium]
MKKTPAELRPKPREVERRWTWEDIPVLVMTLSLPGFEAALPDRRVRRMDRYYRAFERSYARYCQRFLYPPAAEAFRAAQAQSRPFSPWTADVRCRTTLRSGTLWSLALESEERDQAGRCLLRRRCCDSWDLLGGYPLSLAALFEGEPFFRRTLMKHARTELLARQERGERFREDWKKRLRTEFSSEHFYLTEEGLVFYYPMYALGPETLGLPSFFLPWDAEKGPRLPAGLSAGGSLDKARSGDVS